MRYANVVKLLIDWLREEVSANPSLEGVAVGDRVPPGWTIEAGPLLVIRRSGGVASPPVMDRPRVDFIVRHQDEFNATALANVVRALVVHELKGRVLDGHTVYRVVEFIGPQQYQDPQGNPVPLVMFTEELTLRVLT